MIKHPWLEMPDNYKYKMTDKEYRQFELKNKVANPESDKEEITEFVVSSDELNQGDVEDNDDLKRKQKRRYNVSRPSNRTTSGATSMAMSMSSERAEDLKEEVAGNQT